MTGVQTCALPILYRRNDLTLNPEFEAATTDQILPMVKNNLGIGFFPEKMAQEALASGEAFRICLKEVDRKKYPASAYFSCFSACRGAGEQDRAAVYPSDHNGAADRADSSFPGKYRAGKDIADDS